MGYFSRELEKLKQEGNFRELPKGENNNNFILKDGISMINLSSNDYMGLSNSEEIREDFLSKINSKNFIPSYSSSRLLGGEFKAYRELEEFLAHIFQREEAMVFNSGYHANIGIIPAITNPQTLILADRLIHASIIDGVLLSKSKFIRYSHNDYNQLEELIEKHKNDFQRILIISESIFSMDGDEADLARLVTIKKKYNNILLYIDEAHAIGVRGESFLGLSQEKNLIQDIDFLVGTFGKAIASVGAYIVCEKETKEFLVNKMRSFIFSTALPPINILWTKYVFENIIDKERDFFKMKERRERLNKLSQTLIEGIRNKGYKTTSSSHIIPLVLGDSFICTQKSKELQEKGFYALGIRPPTIMKGSERIRFSLNSDIELESINQLISLI